VFATIGVVVLAFGWVEDLAARRKPSLLPRPARVPAPDATPAVSSGAPAPVAVH
jgi:hypothetical protein